MRDQDNNMKFYKVSDGPTTRGSIFIYGTHLKGLTYLLGVTLNGASGIVYLQDTWRPSMLRQDHIKEGGDKYSFIKDIFNMNIEKVEYEIN